MHFLPLLGCKLKDDAIVEILDAEEIDVVYDFDRSHENIEDRYWATSETAGFQFGFDASQTLRTIFLYAAKIDGFTPVASSDCDVVFFSSIEEVESEAARRSIRVTRGKANFLGVQREWVRLDGLEQWIHYEFRGGKLAIITITAPR